MDRLDHILNGLLSQFPDIQFRILPNTLLLPAPNTELREIRIECQSDQIVIELGTLFHTHFYGCEPDDDPTAESARRTQANDAINFVADFINEHLVLWITNSGGAAGVCPVNAPVEYDAEEEYWPNGRPTDRRLLWSRVVNG